MKTGFSLSILLLTLFFPLVAFAYEMTVVSQEEGKPVVDVAIALIPQGNAREGLPDRRGLHEIGQKQYQFTPRFIVVQKGSEVSFPNRDRSDHQVYSFSPVKKFEFPLYRGDSPKTGFDKVGIVPLGCNIHDWMQAYVVVVDTPFYAVSDSDGKADFGDVPAGKYTLEYWHPGMRVANEMVSHGAFEVSTSEPINTLEVPRGKKRPWLRKPSYIEDRY